MFNAQMHTQTIPGADPVVAPVNQTEEGQALKARICMFLAVHSLPFSITDSLVALMKKSAASKVALDNLETGRSSATYALTHGVAKNIKEVTSEKICLGSFSLSIDESTNSANDKISNILVCYFDEEVGCVRTEILGSAKENLANAENIHSHVKSIAANNNLNLDNCISVFMDNCAVMRGKKSGVETRIRKDNPNLLDGHGDTVHIVNNAAKKFATVHGGDLELLASNVFYDIQNSPKNKQLFNDICLHLDVGTPRSLIRPISSRFLYMGSVCNCLKSLLAPLTLFYGGMLSNKEKKRYAPMLNKIFFDCGLNPHDKVITSIQRQVSRRGDTNMSRKDLIVSALFNNRSKTIAYMEVLIGVLPCFENFVKMYQREEPMQHTLHKQMFCLVKQFLSQFVKAELLPDFSVRELIKVKDQLDDPSVFLQTNLLYAGEVNIQKLTSSKKNWWAPTLESNAKAAYREAAKCLLANLPLP